MELILDGSSQTIVGALKDGDNYNCFTLNNNIKHSQKLMGFLEIFLSESKVETKDIEKIGIGVGPGSFTGLRISVAFAKGIASTLGIKMVPIPSMDIYSYLTEKSEVKVVIPAREGFAYLANYHNNKLVGKYELLSYHEALDKIKDNEIVGYGSEKLNIKIPWYKKHLNSIALIRAYQNINVSVTPNELDLIYVQEPLAIRELKKKNDRKVK